MAKKRREPRAVREVKKKMRRESARRKRQYHKRKYNELLEKNEIENLRDYYNLYVGLTTDMKRIAGINCIMRLHRIRGLNPRQIVEFLKIKKA